MTRPLFIWGPPGIGKSALVERFASDVGLDCVSLLGSQLAPEDLIGVPRIVDDRSVFCPPRMIARDTAYLLFVDELNACSFEVQKAFYSLINDRRLGEYYLPAVSIVVGAGNRAQDQAIVKQLFGIDEPYAPHRTKAHCAGLAGLGLCVVALLAAPTRMTMN